MPPSALTCVRPSSPTAESASPAAKNDPRPSPLDEKGSDHRAEDEGAEGRERQDRRDQRRVLEHELQVLVDEQEGAEEQEDPERVDGERGAERRHAEQRQVDQRV